MLHELATPFDGSAIEHLIPPDVPTRPRALAVLDGVLSGRVWTDDPAAPRSALVIEDADGTVYAGGPLTREAVSDALTGVETRSGELIFGFAGSHDPLRQLVPVEPHWTGQAIDFADRRPPAEEAAAISAPFADGARVVQLDAQLLARTVWHEDTLHAFGSAEAWTTLGVGFAVMVDDEMAAEALAGPRCRGLLEMAVVTRERYRRRGFGTLVSQRVARACEARGDRVWWNANFENGPSLAIARRLGFRQERRYELVACRGPIG